MNGQIKFEQAKKNLNDELEDLHDLLIKKIPTSDLKQEILDLKAEIYKLQQENSSKDNIIKNLENEVNSLQRNMGEVGKETEFYRQKNKQMAEEYDKKDFARSKVIEEMLDYIKQIEDLVAL